MKKIIRKIMLLMLIGLGTSYWAFSQQFFYEGFEHNGAFPSDWTLVPGTGDDWVIDDGTTHGPGDPHSGSYTAMFNDYDYSSGTTAEMITPRIDLSSTSQGDSIVLSFWYWDGNGNDVVEVLASTDGQNYTSIYTTPSTVDPWAEQFVDLSDYAGEDTLYISFKGTSIYGYTNPNVDDVSIFKVPPVDLAVVALNNQSGFDLSNNEVISVKIANLGLDEQVDFPIRYSLDGGQTWISEVYGDTLYSGDTVDYSFSTTADLSSIGYHDILVEIPLQSDPLYDNNTFLGNIFHYSTVVDFHRIFTFEDSVSHLLYFNNSEGPQWHRDLIVNMSSGDFSNFPEAAQYCYMVDENSSANVILRFIKQADSVNVSFLSNFQAYWSNGDVHFYVSYDGMNTWNELYSANDDENSGGEQHVFGIESNMGDTVYLRWWYNVPTGDVLQWAIDNVEIRSIPDADLAISDVNVNQEHSCVPSNDTILVTVRNEGSQPQADYVVSYSLDSLTWVSQTISDTLYPGDENIVVFEHSFANQGYYTVYVKVIDEMGADTIYTVNNSANTSLIKQPVIDSFPYTQDFEGAQYWVAGGVNSSWELGTPAGIVINSAASGSNAWVTNLTGNYNADEYSYVESPCFDFSNLHNPLVQFNYWVESESGSSSNYDGAVLEYSTDSGATWNVIGNVGDWLNWYNKTNVGALSSDGWCGDNGDGTNGWVEARHLLNNLAGQPSVKFRFVFASDYSLQYDGFAFDDFTIREGEINLAITEINYNGAEGGTDTTEFIEWYNYGQDAVNVNGFYYSQGVEDTLPDLTVLPGEYFVSAYDSSVMADFFNYTGAITWDAGGLSNGGEDIALHTWWGELVDSVFYDDGNGWPTAADGYGPSLVFCNQNIGLNQNDPANWTVSTSFVDSLNGMAVYASPGAMDSSCMFIDLLVVMPEDSAHYYDCDLSATDTVDIMFTNIGNMDVPAGDTIYFAYQVNSGAWVEDTLVAQANIATGDTLPFTFDQTVDFSALGDYNYRVYVSYYNDNNQMNDTVSGILTHYEPVVDLGPDTILTTQPDTIVLDAGTGFDTYVWNDGSTNQTLAVTCADTCVYYVTATDSNGCSASDTIVIIKQLVYDITVTEPEDGEHYSTCNIGVDTVDIKVSNVGGLTIPAGDEIIAGYQINGGNWVIDTFQLQNDLIVDSSVTLVFSEPYDFTAVGDYDFVVFATYVNDTLNDNDTAAGVLTHYELSVDLGPDTIWTTQPDTIVLDAGAGFDTYLWNDSTTNQTLAVSDYGTYYVTVSDTNGCTASDTVVVQMATVNDFASLGDVVIYPNPSHGEFNVEVPVALVGNSQLYVTDITGKVIYRQAVTSTSVKVNIRAYSEGIYFVKLVSGDATEVYKVIVK